MSANPISNRMTPAEYLEFERESDIRHEFIDGEVYAMAGASPRHNRIVRNLTVALFDHLDSHNCESFGENQRIALEKAKNRDYLYPDTSVVCGEATFTDDNPQALTNPQLIIEVLSPTTAKFDLDEKFALYRQLDTFREYVLVWQDKAKIARYHLNDNNIWEFTDVTGLDSHINLKSIDYDLSLADVYQRVTFDDET